MLDIKNIDEDDNESVSDTDYQMDLQSTKNKNIITQKQISSKLKKKNDEV